MLFIFSCYFVYDKFDHFVFFTYVHLLCKSRVEVFLTMEEVLILQKQLRNPEKTFKMKEAQLYLCTRRF